uniref:Uncharacterized protein LOC113790039 isoform X2 n=1 Tax=Dermatophagoides pteronyssinus TaxID=6956 RepID=A0A6P6XPS3_DERPT|nr:uncharacterized protein LOC113790039 isoform X2 [Dermatophagoides pteronyssinus]
MKKQPDFIDYKLRMNRKAQERQQKYYEEQLQRRRLIGQPSTIEPCLIFIKPIADAIIGLKNAGRLQKEQEKFRKQLDAEEAAEELKKTIIKSN